MAYDNNVILKLLWYWSVDHEISVKVVPAIMLVFLMELIHWKMCLLLAFIISIVLLSHLHTLCEEWTQHKILPIIGISRK